MLQSEAICSATLGTEGDLVIYALVTQPGDTPSSGSGVHSPPEEPESAVESEIDQQLTTDNQRDALLKFRKFQHIFSKAPQDCGVTDLHTFSQVKNTMQSCSHKNLFK